MDSTVTVKKRKSVPIFRWFIIIALPFLLTLWTVRLLIIWDSPSYPEIEYGRIDPDRYGFSEDDRLEYAEATLAYLRDKGSADEVIYLLEDLQIRDSDQPLYNEREIDHMIDVKRLVDLFNQILSVLGIFVLVGLIYLMARPETRIDAYKALMYGGFLTAAILLVMAILIVAAWSFVFVQFHELLFPPDSWTFAMNDSLIRLFPEQFWFDFGVLWTLGILIQGVLLGVIGSVLSRWETNRSQTESQLSA
ncbi:MAG: TIGR01906 family membrane protein [Candidatus Promineifilaceae bacterium]